MRVPVVAEPLSKDELMDLADAVIELMGTWFPTQDFDRADQRRIAQTLGDRLERIHQVKVG